VTRVRLSSPNPSCWYTERGNTLLLAPRSRSARQISICPMVQEIMGHPGSLYFTRMGQDRNSLMLVAKNTFLGTFIFLFFVHIFLRNLAYAGTCWIASRKGMFNLTWLNISSIFSMCMFILLFLSLLGKGAIGLWTCSAAVSFSDVCGADWEELADVEVGVGSMWTGFFCW